jgi:hypothetical protein
MIPKEILLFIFSMVIRDCNTLRSLRRCNRLFKSILNDRCKLRFSKAVCYYDDEKYETIIKSDIPVFHIYIGLLYTWDCLRRLECVKDKVQILTKYYFNSTDTPYDREVPLTIPLFGNVKRLEYRNITFPKLRPEIHFSVKVDTLLLHSDFAEKRGFISFNGASIKRLVISVNLLKRKDQLGRCNSNHLVIEFPEVSKTGKNIKRLIRAIPSIKRNFEYLDKIELLMRNRPCKYFLESVEVMRNEYIEDNGDVTISIINKLPL